MEDNTQKVAELHYNIRKTRTLIREALDRLDTMDAGIKVLKARAAFGAIYREASIEASQKEENDPPKTP